MATLDGLKTIKIRDLRHSCALLLINNGANVTSVAKYLRHTKIEEKLNTYSTKLFYKKSLQMETHLKSEKPHKCALIKCTIIIFKYNHFIHI